MTDSLELSQLAVDDIAEILDWYRDQRVGLDQEFMHTLEKTLEKIQSNPLGYQIRYKDSRNALLLRFPYKVTFKIYSDKIKIVAVTHHSRASKLIRKRLK